MKEFLQSVPIETIIRLVVAMLLGMTLGFERIYARKDAGVRTYALVTLASASFVIISDTVGRGLIGTSFDPIRMASQIVVGVGFLGAGLIMFKDDKITNLTTASGLWVAAAIGIAAGLGLYVEALIITLLALFILSTLAIIERRFKERIAEEDSQDITSDKQHMF